MRSLGTSTPRTRRRSAKTVCRRSVFFVSSFFVPSVLLGRNFVARREDFFACHLPQATCHSRQVWLRPCRARLRLFCYCVRATAIFASTAERVEPSVCSSDSLGMLVTKGPIIQPRPVGISRVSETDSHST